MDNEMFWSWALMGCFVSPARAKLEYEQYREIRHDRVKLEELTRRLQEEGY